MHSRETTCLLHPRADRFCHICREASRTTYLVNRTSCTLSDCWLNRDLYFLCPVKPRKDSVYLHKDCFEKYFEIYYYYSFNLIYSTIKVDDNSHSFVMRYLYLHVKVPFGYVTRFVVPQRVHRSSRSNPITNDINSYPSLSIALSLTPSGKPSTHHARSSGSQ